jgi:hypothetical protein
VSEVFTFSSLTIRVAICYAGTARGLFRPTLPERPTQNSSATAGLVTLPIALRGKASTTVNCLGIL